MGLIQRIWFRWRKIDPPLRRHIKQTATWITLYVFMAPASLYLMMIAIYDLQTDAAVKTITPDEVNDKNFKIWLKKQQNEGKFLDDEPL